MKGPAETPEPKDESVQDEPVQVEAFARLRRLGRNAEGESVAGLVITKFFDEATGWKRALRASLSTGDLANIQRIAHTLRGSASIFGAVRLVEICGELEVFAFNQDAEGCELRLPLFEDALEEVFSALSDLR